MNKWRISSNYINGETCYAVYRKIDPNGVDHSGNREYANGWTSNLSECEKLAAMLNDKEMQK